MNEQSFKAISQAQQTCLFCSDGSQQRQVMALELCLNCHTRAHTRMLPASMSWIAMMVWDATDDK
jgi:hypothetical protein